MIHPIKFSQFLTQQGIVAFFKPFFLCCLFLSLLTGCAIPQVSAQERMFLDLSLDFLGAYSLPQQTPLGDQPVGSLSSVTYELPGYGSQTPSGTIRFYALSDDSTVHAPARFYTLSLDLGATDSQNITVEDMTVLKDKDGQPLSQDSLILESIAFSPRQSVFIATEHQSDPNLSPAVGEYDLKTGQLRTTVPILRNYFAKTTEDQQQIQGIQPKFGLKSLAIAPDNFSPGGLDPFRLFTAPQTPLIQDRDDQATNLRLLHYVIADRASFLVSENLYPLDPIPNNTLAELVAYPGGHLLSLEQSPNTTRIYQLFTGDATDTSAIATLQGKLTTLQPVRKKLLLDLNELDIPLPHFLGMTLGPRLSDSSQTLVLMGHSPENTPESTQFFLFKLKS